MANSPASFEGLGPTLTNARDLLEKLRHDFTRIRKDRHDPYAAFDFFVTAEHMPEWCNTPTVKSEEPLLRVVSHLANGAKHFRATDSRHKSVKGVGLRKGVFNAGIFQADVFDTGGLFVELSGEEATLLGEKIEVHDLARKVLAFWETRLAS
jgi:hypothetical protein